MRTPRQSYSRNPETVYECELDTCSACGGLLVPWHYVSGVKTVQTLSGSHSIAQRPKRCAQDTCVGFTQVWPSAQWQRWAPRGCTYGYDVIALIGWQRQTRCERFQEVHDALRQRETPVQISESQVRYLFHQHYLPLLACHERQHLSQLRALGQSLGLLLSLDGLAPEGGEPQLWVVRELRSGLTVRSGWLSQQSEDALIHFLRPIADLGVPVTAVVSDKQASLALAVAQVFPHSRHQFCQLHFLDNAAAPIAAADEAMKVALRKAVREELGPLGRQEHAENQGVLTVTGVLPSPVPSRESGPDDLGREGTDLATARPAVELGALSRDPEHLERERIVQEVLRRVRYLLTLKGRPPFGLAGLEMFERLEEIHARLNRWLQHQTDERLVRLRAGLGYALQAVRVDYTQIGHAAAWLEAIAEVLDPDGKLARTGEQVRTALSACVRSIVAEGHAAGSARLHTWADGLEKVTAHFAPGLFHCYEVPGLPRTNNARESEFRELRHRLLRTTGQQGWVRRLLQREGAWEVIPRPASLHETIRVFSQVPPQELAQERQRVRAHHDRFRLHTRSAHLAHRQLDQLEQRWRAIPALPSTS